MGREEDTTGMRDSDRFITARDVWLMEAARQDRFTSALAELVAAAGPVWRLGDGYGGWVQERIAGALSDAYGPLAEPHREPAPNRRRKISGTVRNRVMERDAYRCVVCQSWEGLTIDHINPVSRGGTNDIGNLQTMCRSCNSSKGASVRWG